MPLFNLKDNIFMSLFTYNLYISQWKIGLLHIASLNNITKNGSSPLICIFSSILEFCIQQVVPIMLHLSHFQATRKGVLWKMCIHFPNILFAILHASRFLLFIYCRHKSAMTLYIYHTAQSQIFFCILSNTHSTKNVSNKPSKVQRYILYIKCAQIF